MESILYVDDEFINLELFRASFEDEYIVFTANSGHEGLEILEINQHINVIVSDVKMPLMSGFEFISEVKQKHPNKVCIILSAFFQSNLSQSKDSEKDIFRFLNKPWKRSELNEVLIEAVDCYKSLQEA